MSSRLCRLRGSWRAASSLYREGPAFIVAVSLHPDIDRPQTSNERFSVPSIIKGATRLAKSHRCLCNFLRSRRSDRICSSYVAFRAIHGVQEYLCRCNCDEFIIAALDCRMCRTKLENDTNELCEYFLESHLLTVRTWKLHKLKVTSYLIENY